MADEQIEYVASNGKTYIISLFRQEADNDVGIPGGYYFDIDGFDCDDIPVCDDRDEAYADAVKLINLVADQETRDDEATFS